MKATEARLLEFLNKSRQFVIPIYQRTYSWTERECAQLWDDILRTGGDDEINAHFVGSIVYIEKGLYQVSDHCPLLVIDGQQRLTTVMLILEALARQIGDGVTVDGFSARKLREYYLLNPLEEGDRGYKLLLTQTDKPSLLAIVRQRELPVTRSLRIEKNFEYFMERVGRLGDNLSALCLGLRKLVIVDISLSRDQDNPQLIFESMNSTGRELSQADLIRNFILMDLDPDHQNRLYDEHWRPMEVSFGQEAYGDHFDAFMRCYLTLKTGDIPNVRAVYEAFKTYARSPGVEETGIDAIVADIHRFAEHFCRMALDKEADKELAAAFHDLRELKVDVAYPLLLELYEDYCQGALSKPDFAAIVRLVESYVFRRAVCGMPPNSLNKTFATFTRSVRKGCYLESAQAHMLLMPTYRRFPSDEDFTRDLAARDVYNFPRCRYLLKRLENHGRKERVPTDEYTIEHIMPQTISSQWREALGPDWKHTHETFLHTLGNLTLTGYNPEYSNRAFIDKRDRQGGFQHSPLRLNDGLGQLERWDGDAIQARAAQLAAWSCDVWPAPNLPESLLEQYRPVEDKPAAYSVTDHQHLHEEGAMRPVFEAFRQAVLSLDPCVSEEFLKRYIAYKAETNFVDVVPQKSRLRLSLNLRFHELSDPRGIAKDVSNLGRWGNGDVEVGLSTLDDLAYVLGLVRQAFEKQMEGDG